MSTDRRTLRHCPTEPQPGVLPEFDILGCGAHFPAEPDDEGWVECPECGLNFRVGEEN